MYLWMSTILSVFIFIRIEETDVFCVRVSGDILLNDDAKPVERIKRDGGKCFFDHVCVHIFCKYYNNRT